MRATIHEAFPPRNLACTYFHCHGPGAVGPVCGGYPCKCHEMKVSERPSQACCAVATAETSWSPKASRSDSFEVTHTRGRVEPDERSRIKNSDQEAVAMALRLTDVQGQQKDYYEKREALSTWHVTCTRSASALGSS